MVKDKLKDEDWDRVITPGRKLIELNIGEILSSKDLISMLVRRDIVTVYKQTILGPIWYVVQPVLTSLIFIVVFGNIAGISTDGLPKILFYFSGIVIWNYFSESLKTTSKTFKENEEIFGKVYFPRIIVPISKIISGLIKFGIQFVLFLVIYLYFWWNGFQSTVDTTILLFPVLLLVMAILGLGLGLILSSLTAKYRDLTFLIDFGVQLLMYATPIIYPISSVGDSYSGIIQLNPITPIVEAFRYILLGQGNLDIMYLLYSIIFALFTLTIGAIIFSRSEKTFIDTI